MDNLPKEEKKAHDDAIDCLKNYDRNKVRKAMDKVRADMSNNEAPSVGKKITQRNQPHGTPCLVRVLSLKGTS